MQKQIKKTAKTGFTLIEILVVIGLIALLAAIVIVAINPARQFAQGRDTQRTSNVGTILNAIGQNMADNKGLFTCATALPATAKDLSKATLDLRACLVPTYVAELPLDPGADATHTPGSNTCTTATCAGATESYDTKYTVMQDATTARVTVCADQAANEAALTSPAAICVTR
jgi:type IV pilus assembly protein PilA